MGGAEAVLDAGVVLAFAVLSGYCVFGWRPWQVVTRRLRRSEPVPEPVHRPVEALAARARAVGPRVRYGEPGLRFAKWEGLRLGYDHVLADLCAELDVTHLLDVLPPGPELDRERARVELALTAVGVDLALPLV